MTKKAFTLIELLVVVSIISLLSSVVLVALGGARIKARNGRIQSEIITLRNQLEISWNGNSYRDLGIAPNTFSVVEPFTSLGAVEQNVVNDIVAQTPGSTYGGGWQLRQRQLMSRTDLAYLQS